MDIAYTMTRGARDLDPLLADVAQVLLAEGLRVVGIVQVNQDRDDGARCDMDAVVLPDGPKIRISQSLGPAARGCRLDPAGLERAVGETQARLAQADLLILNKFGKQEVAGRGMRPLIAEAVARGVPVLTGVNSLNLEGLQAFAEGIAVEVMPDVDALAAWLRAAHDRATASAP
ncbi:MAG: DUF2478 domain-containing protein [Pseudomonadota bacterium]